MKEKAVWWVEVREGRSVELKTSSLSSSSSSPPTARTSVRELMFRVTLKLSNQSLASTKQDRGLSEAHRVVLKDEHVSFPSVPAPSSSPLVSAPTNE